MSESELIKELVTYRYTYEEAAETVKAIREGRLPNVIKNNMGYQPTKEEHQKITQSGWSSHLARGVYEVADMLTNLDLLSNCKTIIDSLKNDTDLVTMYKGRLDLYRPNYALARIIMDVPVLRILGKIPLEELKS
jgi:hypothetical protein